MSGKAIFILVGVVLVGWQSFRFQQRGKKLEKTQTALKDTSARLSTFRSQNGVLIKKVDSLTNDLTASQGENNKLLRQKADAERDAAQSAEKTRQAISATRTAIAGKTEAERKLATLKAGFMNGDITAERLKDSLSAMPAFTDDQANTAYLNMVAERDAWKKSSQEAQTALALKTKEVSELEVALNDKDRAANRKAEAYQDLRGDVQGTLRKASKGIIKRTFNAGKIKELSKIDGRLGEIQKK